MRVAPFIIARAFRLSPAVGAAFVVALVSAGCAGRSAVSSSTERPDQEQEILSEPTAVISPKSTPASIPDSAPGSAAGGTRVEFAADVEPLLVTLCSPCHFEGGRVYDKMPFDSEETVLRMGEDLFSRITDEQDRALLRVFFSGTDRPGQSGKDSEKEGGEERG